MAISKMFKIKKRIWLPALLVLLPLIIFIGVMYNGIRIDNLSLFNVKITGLYIKLDKKLFVEADMIKIDDNVTKSSSSSSLNDVIDMIPYIHTFFNTIIVNDIEYKNEKVQLMYQDENFYVNSSLLTLKTKIYLQKRRNLLLDMEEMLLKDIDVGFSGKMNINLRRDEYAFNGSFRVFDITGEANLEVKDNMLSYHIASDDFASPKIFLENISKYINLNDTIKNWIYGYTKGSNYKILSLSGKIDLVSRNFYPKNISALVQIDDLNVTFNPNVPPAHVKEVRAKMENDKIAFLLSNPVYQGENLTKADILIYNLTQGKSGIKIDLAANAFYNDSINKIVKAYTNADIPIRQKSGKTDANVSIDVTFADAQANVRADIAIRDADININGVLMHTPYANLHLNNSIIEFKNTRLQYDKLFDISINGTLNASAKEMNADSFIHSILIDAANKSIVSISNISTPFDLNIIDNGITLYIHELESNLTFADTNIFRLDSISRFYPYSEIAQEYGIKNGRITIRSNDLKNFKGYANVRGLDLPLSSAGVPFTRFAGSFEITENSFDIASNNKRVALTLKDDINLTLNSLDINIDLNKTEDIKTSSMSIAVTAKNGSIIIIPSNITILADEYNFSFKEDNISLNLMYKNAFLNFTKDKEHFDLVAKDMRSEFLNALANKEFFKKGNFDFYAKGESEDEFLGVLNLKETRLKDFLVLSNVIAFLNTIPSLATLSDPMYSTSGFPIKNGTVEFIKSKDYLFIQTLFLEGYSSDIEGSGYVDLKTNNVYLDLRIFIIKSLSNIINKIPVVNYIILGDDGTIKLQLSVRGTLNEPKIETNLANDTLMSPFNMIKRVFELPSYLMER
ncbi:MAG: AsmA-like C-terminal domain-containing protein [Campylobacteraceae bacterium]|jgi:hypothetical protein|nr:AsmA-like C-terminal domain-containing protein [Campylobacteraceae bacterium]